MRADEAHLAVALRVVPHRGDDQVDPAFREFGNAVGGVDGLEPGRDAEFMRDRPASIHIVSDAFLLRHEAEQGISLAHADPYFAATIDLHQRLRIRPRAGAGRGLCLARLRQNFSQPGIRRLSCLGDHR